MSIRISRTVSAPVERVWRAFTDPSALAEWFWPADKLGTTATLDLRPGGRYRIDAATAGFAVSGEYLKVDPTTQLAFTWRWDGEDDVTQVSLTLTASAGGCLLELVHDGFADQASSDSNGQGWNDCLDRLPAWL